MNTTVNKWYAIKRPNGEWVPDAVSDTVEQAWEYAFDCENALMTHPHLTRAEVGEGEGYTCVEVELAQPGTVDALKRAREAWNMLAVCCASVNSPPEHRTLMEVAMQALGEVLGRVTDNAAGEGGNA